MEKIQPDPYRLRLVETAFRAGAPSDQLMAFRKSDYAPLPWQWHFHAAARKADKLNGPVKIGVGGARGPGKSHSVFAQITIDDCQRIPELKGLFLRQTGTAARESFEDLIMKVLLGHIEHTYNRSTNVLQFPNGSRMRLGGFKDNRDIDKYIGIEYDFIAIEELNQLTEEKVNKLLGSMRTSKQNWRPRLYASFNPGGLGHEFVKQMFVIPYREQKQSQTVFIPSTYKQNPYLNVEYIDYLENLSGDLGRAWREGDFDLFEGQYFSEWRHDIHVCPAYALPIMWKKFRTIDFGRTAPFVCYWAAVDTEKHVWVYREYYATGKDARENAAAVVALSAEDPENPDTGNVYELNPIDRSVFAQVGQDQTIAELLQRAGLAPLHPAGGNQAMSRVAGWTLFHDYLRWEQYHPSKIHFFPNCVNAIRTIPGLVYDEKHPEDLDTNGEDHAADAIRYLLVSLHEQKSAMPKSDTEKRIEKLQREMSPQYNPNNFYGDDQ